MTMGDRIPLFAVIADYISTEIMKISSSDRLKDMNDEDIDALVETLANENPAWEDVIRGERVGCIFEQDTGDSISINTGRRHFVIM